MNLLQLKEKTNTLIADNPNIESEIADLYFLAKDEIEEGGSVEHECNLAYESMLQMIEKK